MTRPTSLRPGPRHLVAGLAASLLLLSACGDDGGGETLSEADYVAAFEEICLEVDERIGALEADTLAEGQDAAMEAEEYVDDGVSQLRELEAPADIAEEAEMGIDALAQTGEVFGELAQADDEDEFIETGAGIDEARQEAEAALGPLGINCMADVGDGEG